jgi:hypothetical protein
MSFIIPLTAKPVSFTKSGELLIVPSLSSSAADFDFLQGKNVVRHKRLKEPLNHCTEWIDIDGTKTTQKILRGIGNVEKHFLNDLEGNRVDAVALRLFDVSKKLWSLYWADSINGTLDPPLRGSFEGPLGVFFGIDYFRGREILVQFQYDRSKADEAIWGQAFSDDRGATWEWNWLMFFKRLSL